MIAALSTLVSRRRDGLVQARYRRRRNGDASDRSDARGPAGAPGLSHPCLHPVSRRRLSRASSYPTSVWDVTTDPVLSLLRRMQRTCPSAPSNNGSPSGIAPVNEMIGCKGKATTTLSVAPIAIRTAPDRTALAARHAWRSTPKAVWLTDCVTDPARTEILPCQVCLKVLVRRRRYGQRRDRRAERRDESRAARSQAGGRDRFNRAAAWRDRHGQGAPASGPRRG